MLQYLFPDLLCSAVIAGALDGNYRAAPLSKCPDRCNNRGMCGHYNENPPRYYCSCYASYSVGHREERHAGKA